MAIVMEYCQLGTLLEVIHTAQQYDLQAKLLPTDFPRDKRLHRLGLIFYQSWERRLEVII